VHAQQNQLGAEWTRNVTEYRGQVGRRVTLVCPAEGQVGDVWGTDLYTDDSPVCPAAVHAGVITADRGGVVTIVIEAGRPSYPASTRNGVPGKSFGQWQGSYSFVRSSGEGRLDWATTAQGLTPALGQPITLECPANGSLGRIYGTDTYTDDSSICTAAVHAGLISLATGGRITIEAAGGQAAFPGSHRNGVTSREFASWPNGFRFTGPAVALATPSGAPMVMQPSGTAPAPSAAATPQPPASTPAVASTTPAPAVTTPASAPVIPAASTPAATTPGATTSTPSAPTVATAPTTSGAPTVASAPTTGSPTLATYSPNGDVPTRAPSTMTSPTTTAVTGAAVANAGIKQPTGMVADNKGGIDLTPPPALAAPTGITVTPLGVGQVLVRWNAVPDAALYHILYRKVGETQWSTLTDRPGDQPAISNVYQSDQQVVLLPAGQLEFQMFAARDGDDWTGTRTAPVRAVVPRYEGRYRVTLNGFRVNRETFDSPLNYDGQHDEVYVRVGVRAYDADGNVLGPEEVARTKTHGDVNAPRWKQPGSAAFRYAAGNATGLGGLKTGNGFPNQVTPWVANGNATTETFPLFVWEGYLRENSATVAIMPVVYEDDESVTDLSPETKALFDIGTWVGVRGYQAVQGLAATPRPVIQRRPALSPDIAGFKDFVTRAAHPSFGAAFTIAPANIASVWLQRQQQLAQATGPLFQNITAAASLLLNTKDRPIGMAGIEGGKVQFDPTIIRLNFESAEKFVATKTSSEPNVPAGIIAVRYQDTVPGGNGDYTLYLQITRVQ
jgi:hypothetical protein